MLFILSDYSSRTHDRLRELQKKSPVRSIFYDHVDLGNVLEYVHAAEDRYVFLNTRKVKDVECIVEAAKHRGIQSAIAYIDEPISEHRKLCSRFHEWGQLDLISLCEREGYSLKPSVLSVNKWSDLTDIQEALNTFPDISLSMSYRVKPSEVRLHYTDRGRLYLDGSGEVSPNRNTRYDGATNILVRHGFNDDICDCINYFHANGGVVLSRSPLNDVVVHSPYHKWEDIPAGRYSVVVDKEQYAFDFEDLGNLWFCDLNSTHS